MNNFNVGRIEQTLHLFVKGLSERKGIEKNLWAKKFIKSIKYSKEEIAVSFYYKRSSEEAKDLYPASGRVGAAAGLRSGLGVGKKITPIPRYRGNPSKMAPLLVPDRTVDIVIPNVIHGCKKRDF